MNSNEPGAGDPYRIDTPERVELEYDVASLGSRLLAAMVDTFLLSVIYILTIFLGGIALTAVAVFMGDAVRAVGVSIGVDTLQNLGLAVTGLLLFGIFWGYYVLFELFWHGQTPGKRWVGLRVIRDGGYPIGFTESAIRNLVRVIDLLPTSYGIGALTIFIDRRSRRLGDMAAGTLVVKERRELRLESLGFDPRPRPASSGAGVSETTAVENEVPNLHRLSSADQTVLREYLIRRRTLTGAAAERVAIQLGEAFAQKLEYDLTGDSPERFLLRLAKQLELR
jgi:uncharacterized RDD family membrane protein YckC